MDGDAHLGAFVRSFVVSARRDRWLDLLLNRSDRTYQNSSKLYLALDQRYCKRVESIGDIEPDRKGVFFGFSGNPTVMTLSEALKIGDGRDSIFSVVPGALAIHFFHEGEIWLCKKAT